MVAKTTHHLFQPLLYQVATGILSEGEIAPPTREVLAASRTPRSCSARSPTSTSRPARSPPRPRPRDRDAVRLADRRGRRHPVLLRQRPLLRARPRHEEHRRRPRAARPHLRRLRDGRARRQPRRRRRPPADLRRRRRRPHRAWRWPARSPSSPTAPSSATSARSTPARRASSCSTRRPRCCRRSARSSAPRPKAELEKLGVEVILGAMVTDVDERGIEMKFKDGRVERINTVTKIWAAGVQASPLGQDPRRADAVRPSTAPAGSASTPTSRCPATPRSSSSAT